MCTGRGLGEHRRGGRGQRPRSRLVKHSLTGTHAWYPQTYQGRPVIGGYLAVHEYRDGHHDWVDRRQPIDGTVASSASVSASRAEELAKKAAGASKTSGSATLAVLPGSPARLVWSVVVARPTGHERVLIDGVTGDVRGRTRLAADANGSGVSSIPTRSWRCAIERCTTRTTPDYPALAGAYRNVTLTHLDGTGYLRGDYAEIGPMDDLAFSPGLTFNFGRSSPYFEQTMAYYQVTRAQEYIQSLGFTGATINNEPQNLIPDAFPDDNSFYDLATTRSCSDGRRRRRRGRRGHLARVRPRDPGRPGRPASVERQAGAIGEGFGDYWAFTMSEAVTGADDRAVHRRVGLRRRTRRRSDHCLRRVDLNLHTRRPDGEVHHDGQIWSRALWDINRPSAATRRTASSSRPSSVSTR